MASQLIKWTVEGIDMLFDTQADAVAAELAKLTGWDGRATDNAAFIFAKVWVEKPHHIMTALLDLYASPSGLGLSKLRECRAVVDEIGCFSGEIATATGEAA